MTDPIRTDYALTFIVDLAKSNCEGNEIGQIEHGHNVIAAELSELRAQVNELRQALNQYA